MGTFRTPMRSGLHARGPMHGRSLSSDLPAGGENKLNSGRRANVVPKLNVRSTINYKWAWLKLAAPWANTSTEHHVGHCMRFARPQERCGLAFYTSTQMVSKQ